MKHRTLSWALGIILLLGGCTPNSNPQVESVMNSTAFAEELKDSSLATFAGGCFWCMEPSFENLEGVHEVISGYAGGEEENATYKQVISGETAHREAVQVFYDEKIVSYETLLNTYFNQIDPTDDGGQFSDRGFQYTTAIFYHEDSQKELAQIAIETLEEMKKFDKPIVVKIEPFTTFFPAEEYHQDFYKKSADHYERYKNGSGRADFIEENWAKEAALEFSR